MSNILNTTTVYLAGRIDNNYLHRGYEWRQKVGAQLSQRAILVRDPLRNVVTKNDGVIERVPDVNETFLVKRDLLDIEESDIVLVNYLDFASMVGTLCEIGYAYANEKLIFGFNHPVDAARNHMFMNTMVHHFDSWEHVLKAIISYDVKGYYVG